MELIGAGNGFTRQRSRSIASRWYGRGQDRIPCTFALLHNPDSRTKCRIASGNAAFAVWDSPAAKEILLEAWSVIECVAPADLHVERFLPQAPVRTIVDHTKADRSSEIPLIRVKLRRGHPSTLLRNEALKREVLPAMIAEIRNIAARGGQILIDAALQRMHAETSAEIDRLRELAQLNDHVRPGEILELERHQADLASVITHARVRFDSVRLIWRAQPSRAGS